MPGLNDLKNSRFLKKEDVGTGVLVTIDRWEQDNVAMENEPEKLKYIIYFKELTKGLSLNVVNGETIAAIVNKEGASDDFDLWIGTEVILYNEPNVMMGTQRVGGIRVRDPRPAKPVAAVRPQQAQQRVAAIRKQPAQIKNQVDEDAANKELDRLAEQDGRDEQAGRKF